MSAANEERGPGVLAAVSALLAVAACCAGPALLAGGVLGAVGGLLRNPLVIAAAVLIVSVAVGYAVLRILRRNNSGTGEVCCPPGEPHAQASGEPSTATDGEPAKRPISSKGP